MKWRNSKERELLSTGGTRESTLPNKSNPNPDLSDVKMPDESKSNEGEDSFNSDLPESESPRAGSPASSMPGSPDISHDAMSLPHVPMQGHEHMGDVDSEIDSDEEITVS